jgi:hypothetical protein
VRYRKPERAIERRGDLESGEVSGLFQVSADMTDPDTRRRELSALEEAMQETGVGAATVVTLRETGRETTKAGSVRILPAWRWLLRFSAH